jgi:hypothetical protein
MMATVTFASLDAAEVIATLFPPDEGTATTCGIFSVLPAASSACADTFSA